jgi:hypothetical protein
MFPGSHLREGSCPGRSRPDRNVLGRGYLAKQGGELKSARSIPKQTFPRRRTPEGPRVVCRRSIGGRAPLWCIWRAWEAQRGERGARPSSRRQDDAWFGDCGVPEPPLHEIQPSPSPPTPATFYLDQLKYCVMGPLRSVDRRLLPGRANVRFSRGPPRRRGALTDILLVVLFRSSSKMPWSRGKRELMLALAAGGPPPENVREMMKDRQRAPRGLTCLHCKLSKVRCDLGRPCNRSVPRYEQFSDPPPICKREVSSFQSCKHL